MVQTSHDFQTGIWRPDQPCNGERVVCNCHKLVLLKLTMPFPSVTTCSSCCSSETVASVRNTVLPKPHFPSPPNKAPHTHIYHINSMQAKEGVNFVLKFVSFPFSNKINDLWHPCQYPPNFPCFTPLTFVFYDLVGKSCLLLRFAVRFIFFFLKLRTVECLFAFCSVKGPHPRSP